MTDMSTVYTCYLAIITGLFLTLVRGGGGHRRTS